MGEYHHLRDWSELEPNSRLLNMARIDPSESDAINMQMSTLHTNQERVKYILSVMRDDAVLLETPGQALKSLHYSELYQKTATQLFSDTNISRRLDRTIDAYTKSIVFALPQSQTLALGYANRSAALFTAGLYQDCLRDIERALLLPYPDNLKSKLYARQARCWMALRGDTNNYIDEISKALQNTAEHLDQLPESDATSLRMAIKILNDPEKMIPSKAVFKKWQAVDHMPRLADESTELKGVSSALKVQYNQQFGRHVIATRDIKSGEVIAVMKPYANYLLPEKRLTHCDYCLEQTWSSVPCDICCQVVYCNEDCKTKACNEYHDIECKAAMRLIAQFMPYTTIFAMRLAIMAIKEAGSIRNLRKKVKALDKWKDPRTLGFTKGVLEMNYDSIYPSFQHCDKVPAKDHVHKALLTSFILIALAVKSDLFGKRFSSIREFYKDNDVTFIGGLLLKHHQIILTNMHPFHEEDLTDESLPKAVLLTPLTQMNHCCQESFTKIGHGLNMVWYSNYEIRKGEQVFDNYGFFFDGLAKRERQELLRKRYHFTCCCDPCAEEWPMRNGLNSVYSLSQRTQNRIENGMKKCEEYLELSQRGELPSDLERAIAIMNSTVKYLQEIAPIPWAETLDIVHTRKRILRLLGNRLQSVDCKK